MSKLNKKPKLDRLSKQPRAAKNQYVTKNGQKIKLHRNLGSRLKARKDARMRKKAAYLATLPKGRIKRTMYRMHPKRMAKYWFSRQGAIMGLKITGAGILVMFLLLVGIFAYFRKDLPNLRDISGNNIGGSIRYYDRTGNTLLFEDYDTVKRNPVEDPDIAQVMKDATVAVEDKDFFKHGGFDVRGITRAGVNNVVGGGSTQGGSTITQQLVKLTQNWSKERTYTRKVKELILSVELERSYTKKEILAGYLNTAPYGDITYGAEAAMRDYFQKSAKDITLDEAAFLAAIPKSPTLYSPYGSRYDKGSLIGRQHYILDLMAEQGMITGAQRDEAKKIDTIANIKPRAPSKYTGITAPWFVLTAKESLIAERGAETVRLGGLKVITTLDLDKQRLAEEQVQKGLRQVQRQGGDSISFVAEDVKTGQVVALVGGVDFNNKAYGENNYARAKLPPGSSFKPYDYISVIENTDQFGAGTVLYDSPDPLEGYPCTNKNDPKRGGNCLRNYDLRYPGPVTIRYALGGSRNVPAVKAFLTAGADKTIDVANRLGLKDKGGDIEGNGYKCYEPGDESLTKEAQCGGSAAIGDGAYLKLDEHVHAYSTISRNGRLIPQTYILKIQDASNKTVMEWKPSEGKQAVREDSAYIVADMMSDPKASYFSNPKPQTGANGWKFSLKTGTTNDRKDGWMLGFSTQYSVGVWVGDHTNQVEMTGAMENMTLPIWNGWMKEVHKNIKNEERPRPKGVQSLPSYIVRSHVGFGSVEPSPTNDLYPSWYKAKQRGSGNQTIDIVSGKLATDCTPGRARQNAANAAANIFSSDKFHPGGGGASSSNTSEKDDVHKCEDAKPSITITGPATCAGNCSFTATVTQGTHPLSGDRFRGTINFKVGDQIVQTKTVSNSPSTVQFDYNSTITGQQGVSAEIIDSVLYDSVDSLTVSFSGPESGSPATPTTISLSVSGSGTNFNFNWTTISGGAPYQLCIASTTSANNFVCSAAGNPASEPRIVTGNNKKAYVKSSSGVQSNTAGF